MTLPETLAGRGGIGCIDPPKRTDAISMLRVTGLALASLALCLPASAAKAPRPVSPDATIAAIRASPGFRTAMATLDREHDRTVEDTIRLTEIPAPPFKE